jgi:hypothetical protein
MISSMSTRADLHLGQTAHGPALAGDCKIKTQNCFCKDATRKLELQVATIPFLNNHPQKHILTYLRFCFFETMDSISGDNGTPGGQFTPGGNSTTIDANRRSTEGNLAPQPTESSSTSKPCPLTTTNSFERKASCCELDAFQNEASGIDSSPTAGYIPLDDRSREESMSELRRLAQILNMSVSLTPISRIMTDDIIPKQKKPTFLTLPTEILLQILEILLVNPILSTAASNAKDMVPCGLHPSVIGACKRIKDLGESLLYGKNTFFILCTTANVLDADLNYIGTGPWYLNPLARSKYSTSFNISDYPGVTKVRNRKVLVSAYGSLSTHPNSLTQFCRAISDSRPSSLEVILIPMGVEASLHEEHPVITDILEPLRMLRGVQKATIRDSVPSDVDSDVEARIHRRWKPICGFDLT